MKLTRNIEMKRYIRQTFLVLLYTVFAGSYLLSQNKTDPNGYNIFYHPNGEIASEGYMKDGKPDGYWKTYFPTGQIKSEGNRKNFLLDSIWVFYNEQGDTLEKINYLHGKKNGYFYTYRPALDSTDTNSVISKELYIDDQKQGLSYYYYKTGELKQVTPYKDNKKHGEGKVYAKDGTINTLITYNKGMIIEKQYINRRDEQGLKQGYWKHYYDTGNLKTEAYYVDDKRNGYYREYDESGNLISAVRYVDGEIVIKKRQQEAETQNEETVKIEVKSTYYPDGQIKSTGAYKDTIPVGLHKEFTQEGDIAGARVFDELGHVVGVGAVDENDNRQGKWIHYYPDGSIKSQGNYTNGQRQGLWTFYYRNGQVEQTGRYRNGRYEGTWKWYYENGALLRVEEFERGLANGEMIEYARDSSEIARGEFIAGEKEGEWFHHVNDEREEGSYIAGKRNGEWRHYYPDGQLKFKGDFVQGLPNGKHRYYYENGRVKEEGRYVMGKKVKNWRKYDPEGNLYLTITYKNGEKYKIDGSKIDKNRDRMP
jgi:uncharacterized protein